MLGFLFVIVIVMAWYVWECTNRIEALERDVRDLMMRGTPGVIVVDKHTPRYSRNSDNFGPEGV